MDVLVRVSIAEMKHHDQNPAYVSTLLFIIKGSQDIEFVSHLLLYPMRLHWKNLSFLIDRQLEIASGGLGLGTCVSFPSNLGPHLV